MPTYTGDTFPVRTFPEYSWPIYTWPGIITDIEYTEVVRLSVVLDKTFSANVKLNKSPSFSQILSKTVTLTTYIELEDNS